MQTQINSSSSVTRRQFVSSLGLAGAMMPIAAAGGLSLSATPVRAASVPSVPRGADSMTIHVMSKPLHQLSYTDAARLVADCGFGGIDYTVRLAQGHVRPERVQEDLPRAIEAAHAAGLKAEMITTAITGARDEHAETVLRTAAKYGVKYYRLGYWRYEPALGVVGTLEKLKPALVELAGLNASLGIRGAMQNHSGAGVGSPVWDYYELLRDIDPRSLGMQYDIRHATAEGGQSWPVVLRLLRPWICCSNLKDFRWRQSPGAATIEDTPLGEGIVPFDAYFKLVRELGLTGPVSMHFEYPPFERLAQPLAGEERRVQFMAGMKRDLAVLQGYLARHSLP
jgi:sugar phosphate isomerase/epimerase